MGYGGNLIWTSALKTLNELDGKPVAVALTPGLSDLMTGRMYEGTTSLESDVIFRNNPRLVFPKTQAKSAIQRFIDKAFGIFIRSLRLQRNYELYVFNKSRFVSNRDDHRLVHIDMRLHSYAECVERDHIVWKPQRRAADAVLSHFNAPPASTRCELYFTPDEENAHRQFWRDHGLHGETVLIEPDTNRDYFGELRSWPKENWTAFIETFSQARPTAKIVQIGLKDGPPLPGVIDLRGETDFRGAALLLRSASLFIGTEGGLSHAANAVGANALILWGGITLPEFAGYPDQQKIICKYVSCAPCGRMGHCDNDHVCMRSIEVEEVTNAAIEALNSYNPGHD